MRWLAGTAGVALAWGAVMAWFTVAALPCWDAANAAAGITVRMLPDLP